jgi:secondary thiamine-phosphate synthase enzyme
MGVTSLFLGRTVRRGSVHSLGVRSPRRLSCLDITERVSDIVRNAGVSEGTCVVYCAHTTCTVLINEWENGILADLAASLERLIPSSAYYAHDDLDRRTQNLQANEPPNGSAHLAQLFLGGPSQTIPVSRGELLMGRWQRIIFVELDEPRDRIIHVQLLPAWVDPYRAD